MRNESQTDKEFKVVSKILNLETKIKAYERTQSELQKCKQSIDDNNDNENKYTGSKDPVLIEKRYNSAVKSLKTSLDDITKDQRVNLEFVTYVKYGKQVIDTKITYNGDYYKSTKLVKEADLRAIVS